MWGIALNLGVLATLWLLARKKRIGFLVGILMECGWFWWSIFVVQDFGFTLFSIGFAAMYAWGWVRWKREDA